MKERIPTTFESLTKWLEPRPIRNEGQYRRMQGIVDELSGLKLNRAQEDFLETLATLMEAYEQAHHGLDNSSLTAVEILGFLMEQWGMNASDLGRLLGDRSVGSRILRGERELSKRQMQLLGQSFHVQPGIFLRPEPSKSG